VSVDPNLLSILCCPVTHQPLKVMGADTLSKLNRVIGERGAKQRDGSLLEQPLELALCTEDERIAYPVRDGIPVLLEECGILLTALD
jgi:uncharacterized protein YbaR (Trm112 family)